MSLGRKVKKEVKKSITELASDLYNETQRVRHQVNGKLFPVTLHAVYHEVKPNYSVRLVDQGGAHEFARFTCVAQNGSFTLFEACRGPDFDFFEKNKRKVYLHYSCVADVPENIKWYAKRKGRQRKEDSSSSPLLPRLPVRYRLSDRVSEVQE